MNSDDIRLPTGIAGYSITSDGRVFSDKSGKWLKSFNWGGYLVIGLWTQGTQRMYGIHRLVARSFLGEPPTEAHQVNHKNGIKHDPRVENLEWVTATQNAQHAQATGLTKAAFGVANGHSKLNDDLVRAMRLSTGSQNEIARKFGVSRRVVRAAISRETWKHVA